MVNNLYINNACSKKYNIYKMLMKYAWGSAYHRLEQYKAAGKRDYGIRNPLTGHHSQ